MNSLLIRLGSFGMQKVLIAAAIVGGLYYFFIFDDGSALDARAVALSADLEKEKQKLNETNAALKEVEQVRATVGNLTDQYKVVSAQLPSELQMSEVIRTVDQAAKMSGISLKLKEPKAPVKEKEGVAEALPMRLQSDATYSEIGAFLYDLGKTERLIKVRSITLTGPQDLTHTRKITMDAEIASYRFTGKEIAKDAPKDAVGKPAPNEVTKAKQP